MKNKSKKYFLAANSCEGFISYFNLAYDSKDGWQAYIIKGGPGTGKSTFMKRVAFTAEEKGFEVEYCYCSSDPDSLDAVIIPRLKLIIMDGTAPHTVDPAYPAVSDRILNFGEFWDESLIKKHADEIISVTDKNKSLHKTASRYLSSAGSLLKDSFNSQLMATDISKAKKFAKKLCEKYIQKEGKGTKERIRFLSGISPKGIINYSDTLLLFSEKPIIIEDEFGGVSNIIMNEVRNFALNNHYEILTFKNALLPNLIDHIVIPELHFVLARENKMCKINFDVRRIHAERFIKNEKLKSRRLKYNTKTANAILDSAALTLKKAKETHDVLESFYIKAMDFRKLEEFTEKNIEQLLK